MQAKRALRPACVAAPTCHNAQTLYCRSSRNVETRLFMTQGCTETIPLTKKPTRPEFSTSCPPHTPYNMHPSLKLVDSRPTRAHRPKHGTRRHRPGTVQWALQHLATARAPQGGFYTLSMLGDEEAPRAGDSPSRRHDGPAPRTDSYNSKAARSKLTCPVAAQERPVRQNKTWVCGGIQRAQRPSGARDTPWGWWRFCWARRICTGR